MVASLARWKSCRTSSEIVIDPDRVGCYNPAFGLTMANTHSAGSRLRSLVASEHPLQVVGVINAMCALLAREAGFRAIYLSGAGVANASRGLPDLGMTTLDDVLTDARRIAAAVDLPLLVDADTGWDIARTVRALTDTGVAGMHIEDQVDIKRCGHRPGKQVVSTDEMVARIEAATDARSDEQFVVMARTDAAAVEGLDAAIERANRYVEAGADMIFAEALTEPAQYKRFTSAVGVPVLANVTEFGRTPLMTVEQLRGVGVALALYPLSAFRAMNAAALDVYQTIAGEGTQNSMLDRMQTRDELYKLLNYHEYERQIDQQFAQEKTDGSSQQ